MISSAPLYHFLVASALVCACASGCVRAQDEEQEGAVENDGANSVQSELQADVAEIVPGSTFKLGVAFTIAKPWHIYWKNPGDAGLPTKVEFELPTGLTAGELEWPPHIEFIQPGNIKGYGYEGHAFLSAPITVSKDIADDAVLLKARVRWLACSDRCIPGKATLETTLPVKR